MNVDVFDAAENCGPLDCFHRTTKLTYRQLLEVNERECGEEITVRQCLATFTLINPA